MMRMSDRLPLLCLAVGLLPMASPSWPLTADLVEEVLREDLFFGGAVAVDGDTALIAAPSSYLRPTGVAYVFVRTAEHWTQQAELLPETTFKVFGTAAALQGDVAVVTEFGGGSAYVFRRHGSRWSEEARIFPGDAPQGDAFGRSAAIDDGTIVIGSFHGPDTPGAAYVFTRSGGAWVQQSKLQAPVRDQVVYFGASVDTKDDRIVIGAPGTGGPDLSAAYVFERSGTSWTQQAKLTVADESSMGMAVSLDGNTALIGGYSGVHVFTSSAGAWSRQATLMPSDAHGFDYLYGGSVAVEGNVALVGASRIDSHWTGAAYLYRHDRGKWQQEEKLVPEDRRSNDQYGLAVAIDRGAMVIGMPGRPGAHILRIGPEPDLHCPGDIDGDDLADLVAVTSRGEVVVKGLDGTVVNQFELDATSNWIDSELISDTNGNGAPELAVLTGAPAGVEIRDLLTGARLGSVTAVQGKQLFDLEILPDRTGNGVPELAILSDGPVNVEVRDAMTAEVVGTLPLSSYVFPMDLEIYPDLDGDGAPELAMLGDNRRNDGADKIELRDPTSGGLVQEIWLAPGWRVLQLQRMGDQNSNGFEDLAVLRTNPAGNVNVVLRDGSTRAWLGSADFDKEYPPRHMLRLGDLNGNGSDEIAVFGWRLDLAGNNQKVKIRDSRTGALVGPGEVFFDRNWPVQDIVTCSDLNGNHHEELAALGRRQNGGALKVIVKDAESGERIAEVAF